MWYVNGYSLRGQACEIYRNKPTTCSGYLIFNNAGELEMHLTETDTKFACLYDVQNDKLKLQYSITFTATKKTEQVNLFYKLKELPSGRDYELVPIAEAEFK